MTEESHPTPRWRRKRPGAPAETPCPCCGTPVRFRWRCPCGFEMCQACMDENAWGLTCNGITWTCPDCGVERSY